MTVSEADVVVIGAGLAGLAAGHALQRAGRRVMVLEAGPEVGGRARTRNLDGIPADLGGEWVGSAHRRVRRLAGELGVDIEPAHTLGAQVRWQLPSGQHIGRVPPRQTWPALIRLARAAAAESRGVDPDRPWRSERASDLDAVSLSQWLDTVDVRGDTRYIVDRVVGSLSSSRTEDMSLLQFLWWMRLAGGPLRTLRTTFQSRVVGGAQTLARAMADELRVSCDSRVAVVAQGDEVGATTDDGRTYRAPHAVVAVPVQVLDELAFDPPLPTRQQELSRLHVGPGTKVVALLPPSRGRPAYHTVVGGSRLWIAWRVGRRVTGFVPPQADRVGDAELVSELGAAFDIEPEHLDRSLVMDWSTDPGVRGCDIAFSPTQVCSHGPRLREPDGRLLFAGAERSSWPNNMEGALESGERAARELLRTG